MRRPVRHSVGVRDSGGSLLCVRLFGVLDCWDPRFTPKVIPDVVLDRSGMTARFDLSRSSN
jgi:hypothetical protein